MEVSRLGLSPRVSRFGWSLPRLRRHLLLPGRPLEYCLEDHVRQRLLLRPTQSDDDDYPAYADGDDDDDDDEDDTTFEEGPLNIPFEDKVDKVRYVDELPVVESSASAQPQPGARHCLDLLKRFVYRLAEPSSEERVEIWRQMRRDFEGHVVDGCLQVVLSPSLPLLEVKLGVPFADGPARLKLLGRPDTKLPPQPRSATPEASFMIRHCQVVVENVTVQRPMQNWYD